MATIEYQQFHTVVWIPAIGQDGIWEELGSDDGTEVGYVWGCWEGMWEGVKMVGTPPFWLKVEPRFIPPFLTLIRLWCIPFAVYNFYFIF